MFLSKELDKFYTNPKVINKIIVEIDYQLKSAGILPNSLNWIEPSAGSGNFIDALRKHYTSIKIKGFDIDPKNNPSIIKKDFLLMNISYSEKNIFIGNPPFGKRADLAIKFINKSSEFGDIIVFILPNQFKRFLTQKQVSNDLKLIKEGKMERDSFLINDRVYNVNCIFQIWVKKDRKEFKSFKDRRLYKQPPRIHNDLELYIYNNTEGTRKYFNKKKYGWNFAIHRQGYYNYNKLILKESELISNRQYLFIKCKNEICKKIVPLLNFEELSQSNTSIPGFSNENFIKLYKKKKSEFKKENKNDSKEN